MLGIVTIGQAPRPDLVDAFTRRAPGADVRVLGALDGIGDAAIGALARRPTSYPLLVRLADGRALEIGLEWLQPLVERRAVDLVASGARVVVVACAGAFPAFACEVPVLLPGQLVPAAVAAFSPRRLVGIVTPVAGQVDAARAKWRADGFDPLVTWASPACHDDIARAAGVLREADVDLVVLDCMGHDAAYARTFADLSGHRVVTAQDITADAAAAHLAGAAR